MSSHWHNLQVMRTGCCRTVSLAKFKKYIKFMKKWEISMAPATRVASRTGSGSNSSVPCSSSFFRWQFQTLAKEKHLRGIVPLWIKQTLQKLCKSYSERNPSRSNTSAKVILIWNFIVRSIWPSVSIDAFSLVCHPDDRLDNIVSVPCGSDLRRPIGGWNSHLPPDTVH